MTSRARPKALVVERDRAAGGRIAAMLEAAGIVVATVADGAAALSAVAREQYDLAIVTTSLAGALGEVDLVREIRSRRPGLELLFVAETAGTAAAPPPARNPRRFAAPGRERLAHGHSQHRGRGDEAEAEFGIASARLACLRRRRAASHGAVGW